MKKKFKSLLRPYWRFVKESARSIQSLLIVPLRSLPVSSEVIGPPKGFYPSTADWVAKDKAGQNQLQGTYKQIYPSEPIHRGKPGTLEETVHWKFRLEYQRQLPASFVVMVPKGRAWVNRGNVVDSSAIVATNDRVLSDVSLEFGRTGYNHSIFTQWKLPPVHYVPGTVAALSSAKANIYFHWMTDVLPKIELLRLSGLPVDRIDKFIVNGYNSPFQKETLATLGIYKNKVIESCKEHHVKADQLLVPSLPSLPGNVPQWVCDFLRKNFLYSQESQKSATPERIYISRGKASYRRIINEPEVFNCLDKLGFQAVALETLSIAEQALLFASAKVVVAPHGAGLTNLVFCQPGTTVVEFFSPKYVNVCYYAMSDLLGLNYYYLIGEGQNPPEGIDPHLAGEDILVKLESLSSLLKLASVS
ncbi:MAG: glycosyltransferase family 61 protein [Kastovskya adunca ATA6-11-RM4]|jgi:hypothetical protein|nr:glycosyltransferase family 61 protein [Kastovskya adunca ATA6-11-RM4]